MKKTLLQVLTVAFALNMTLGVLACSGGGCGAKNNNNNNNKNTNTNTNTR